MEQKIWHRWMDGQIVTEPVITGAAIEAWRNSPFTLTMWIILVDLPELIVACRTKDASDIVILWRATKSDDVVPFYNGPR